MPANLCRIAAYFALFWGMFILLQCGKTDIDQPNAQVKIINAHPVISTVYANLNNYEWVEGVSYNNATPQYHAIPATNQNNIGLYDAQSNNRLLNLLIKQVKTNVYYSLLLLPHTLYPLDAVWLTDSMPATPADSIKLRLINASPDAGELLLFSHLLPQDTLIQGVTFNPANPAAITGFAKLAPASAAHNLTILNALTADTLLQCPNLLLQAGGSYSLVLSGYVSEQTALPLTYLLITHQP